MLYDILATLWEEPANADRLDCTVRTRGGLLQDTQSLERYLQLLEECGYVRATERDGGRVYALADRGSQLLASFAEARESGRPVTFMEFRT